MISAPRLTPPLAVPLADAAAKLKASVLEPMTRAAVPRERVLPARVRPGAPGVRVVEPSTIMAEGARARTSVPMVMKEEGRGRREVPGREIVEGPKTRSLERRATGMEEGMVIEPPSTAVCEPITKAEGLSSEAGWPATVIAGATGRPVPWPVTVIGAIAVRGVPWPLT